MIYLSGRIVDDNTIGVMLSYNANHLTYDRFVDYSKGKKYDWAMDNGCFSQPNKYSDAGFINHLTNINDHSALFAVAPDVLGDNVGTKIRSIPMLRKIRELGYKAAYVIQDGEKVNTVCWDELDCIFVGGTTQYKLSQDAENIVKEAKNKDKWVHMGRVNTWTRFKNAKYMGCDSADGNCIAFAPDINTKLVLSWLNNLEQQPFLGLQQ
tara:strand:- start:899 stop:1525 length:627 start_codon:yes stop_codon:yes gene_type:complete